MKVTNPVQSGKGMWGAVRAGLSLQTQAAFWTLGLPGGFMMAADASSFDITTAMAGFLGTLLPPNTTYIPPPLLSPSFLTLNPPVHACICAQSNRICSLSFGTCTPGRTRESAFNDYQCHRVSGQCMYVPVPLQDPNASPDVFGSTMHLVAAVGAEVESFVIRKLSSCQFLSVN